MIMVITMTTGRNLLLYPISTRNESTPAGFSLSQTPNRHYTMKDVLRRVSAGMVGAVSTALLFWALGSFQAIVIEELGVPSGAIAAFEGACPSGWERYTAAEGVFIRGARNAEEVAARGGNATQRFTKTGNTFASTSRSGFFTWVPPGRDAGDDRLMSTMPPYIALTYCKKE